MDLLVVKQSWTSRLTWCGGPDRYSPGTSWRALAGLQGCVSENASPSFTRQTPFSSAATTNQINLRIGNRGVGGGGGWVGAEIWPDSVPLPKLYRPNSNSTAGSI